MSATPAPAISLSREALETVSLLPRRATGRAGEGRREERGERGRGRGREGERGGGGRGEKREGEGEGEGEGRRRERWDNIINNCQYPIRGYYRLS